MDKSCKIFNYNIMDIITNKDEKNSHYSVLADLIQNANELLIVTPFISSNLNLIPQKYFAKIKALTFITTLPALYTEQEKKIKYFLFLLDLASKYNFSLEILIDDSLHGKVYIGKTEQNFKAIITSANFTKNGLQTNNEWGVCFDEKTIISDIWQRITTSSRTYKLTPKEIYEYDSIIKANKIPPQKNALPSYSLPVPITSANSNPASKYTCWLKPIGTKEHQISDNELHNSLFRDITFKVKPVGIKEGDIIICYAAYRKHIVSVYKAASNWFLNKTTTSFPYSIKGENLFPYYGSEWAKRGITIDTIKSEVISGQQFTITPNGANDYKRLQQADKMKVTSEYADLVIQKIKVVDNEIAFSMITD